MSFHADIVVPLVSVPTCPTNYRRLASMPVGTVREAEVWLANNRITWWDALLPEETRFQMLVTDGGGELALLVEHESADRGVRYSRRALRAMKGGRP